MNKKLLIAAALATSAVGGIAVTASAMLPRGPMAADTNGDGVVTRSEFFTAAQARFAKRDTNGDRKLSGDEIDTGRRGEKLLREDANKDGIISFAEIAAWSADDLARFDQALSLKGRAVRDAWVAQARRFADA